MQSSKQHKWCHHQHEQAINAFEEAFGKDNLAANNNKHHNKAIAAIECDDGGITYLESKCAPSASSPRGVSDTGDDILCS